MCDRFIDPQAAERDATPFAVIDVRASTVVSRDHSSETAVLDVQHAAAAAAAKQAGEQRAAAAGGLPFHSRLHVRVRCDDRLIALVLFPRKVLRVVITKQDGPGGSRFPVADGLASPAVDDSGPCFRLAECVRPCVHRIRQDCENAVVHG